jgi:dTDP-4-dehydrorhamnose reductase
LTEPSANPVWITGAGGLIGNALVATAPRFAPALPLRALARPQLDLLDFDAVRRAFDRDAPRLVIHCAALAHTPTCETNPGLARRLNVDVTALLAGLARDIPLVFFSSDMVFDGLTGNYDESSARNPLGVYGRTKADAEDIVLANPGHLVVRTSLNGGTSPTGNRGFNEQLRLAFRAGKTLQLFTDEIRCPIPAVETARAVWELAARGQAGLCHVAGSEPLSRWQIGQLIAARWPGLHPKIEPESVRNFKGPPRAPNNSMDCSKAQALLPFPLPGLTAWLAQHPDEPF